MARGRVRGVSDHSSPGSPRQLSRIAIDRGSVAAAPAGSIGDPRDLGGLSWFETSLPNTAAGALRAARAWSWEDQRAFDAEDWWWRVPLGGAHGVLGLDGIATLWDAWIDGVHVASGDNMFLAKQIVIETPAQELVIRCRALEPELAKKRPRPRWRVPMIEKQQLRWIRTTLLGRTPGWSPPCPAVGPWRPLWIEQSPRFVIEDFAGQARLEGTSGVIECVATMRRYNELTAAKLVVTRGDLRVTTPLEDNDGLWFGQATIPKPALWWPHTHGEPARYRLAVEATSRRGETFVVDLGHTGFRTIVVDRDGDDFAVRVNGAAVFCRGACWTPLDVVTLAAPAESYRGAVAQMRDAGMNMLRVGGTIVYEDDALYDALDEHGVLLWQDLMFANMDYPEDAGFIERVVAEVDQELARLQARPCLAVVCGNSEVEQQAAMSGAPPERWSPPLFHEVIPARVEAMLAGVAYVPSSTHGGAFPHQPSAGVSSYYGVGAYMRPLEDARHSDVRFASECLAFANIPNDPALPRVHDPKWKARSPRDLGAGWDFDDVRDHYVQRLYGIDPVALRVSDHERYLELGRVATGEVMAQTFAEWRRARSRCRGALLWFLRDLWPGAGWGVVDAHGAPKPAWYALRRALAPVALAITNEGNNGLAIQIVNDRPEPLAARLDVTLWRSGLIRAGQGGADVAVPAHGAIELAATSLFEGFLDLSFAYRFGPPIADVIHATLWSGDRLLGETFAFPAGLPSRREGDLGLAVSVKHTELDHVLSISASRFAQHVAIEAARFVADDNYFHLAPGQIRTVRLRPSSESAGAPRGIVTALNGSVAARFEVTK
ncbi:MAG: beta-mannosidase [Myxococcales bacterium]|nr:beta-mannosidase [Myxococcales bacterium]